MVGSCHHDEQPFGRHAGDAAVDSEPWRPTVEAVTVIGDETTHGSDLRGSSLSVLETIAPSETVLDPIPEEDDNQWVAHLAQYEEIETAIKTGNPVWTFCGKLLYAHKSRAVAVCRACKEARPADYRYDPDFWSKVG